MKGASLIAPFGLRMPEDLKEKVAARAKANGRSMNAEIVQILQDVINIPSESDLDEVLEHLKSTVEIEPDRDRYLRELEKIDPLKAKVLRLSESFSQSLLQMMKEPENKK